MFATSPERGRHRRTVVKVVRGEVRGLKKLLVLFVLMVAAFAVTAPTALAGGQGDPCPVQGGATGASIVDNDDAIKARGAGGLALAPLAHEGAGGAWSPAGAAATDRILPVANAVIFAGADDARVELGELTPAVNTASAPPARVEHCAVRVVLA